MKYILNSAVVTTEGTYRYQLTSINSAIEWLKDKNWISTIGYEETALALSYLTGVSIPVNRKIVRMTVGDEALVFRLTGRIDNIAKKGNLSYQFILANCEIGFLKKIA